MGHHINMQGKHVMLLNPHNLKKGAQDMTNNSLHMKKECSVYNDKMKEVTTSLDIIS